MNVTCSGTGTYPQAMALMNAINAIDGRVNIEANIKVGGVGIWLSDPSFLPAVEAVCRIHGVKIESGATAAMEEVILQNPNCWKSYAESRSNGDAVISEWIVE
jgi:hypothetical protein